MSSIGLLGKQVSLVCRGCKQPVRLEPRSLLVVGGIGLALGLGAAAVAWVKTGGYSKYFFFIVVGINWLTVVTFGRLVIEKQEEVEPPT